MSGESSRRGRPKPGVGLWIQNRKEIPPRASWEVPGLAIAIVKDDKVVFAKSRDDFVSEENSRERLLRSAPAHRKSS